MIDVTFPPQRVKAIRESMGLNQRQFAERLGLDASTVSYWESGSRTPRDAQIVMRLIELEREAEASA